MFTYTFLICRHPCFYDTAKRCGPHLYAGKEEIKKAFHYFLKKVFLEKLLFPWPIRLSLQKIYLKTFNTISRKSLNWSRFESLSFNVDSHFSIEYLRGTTSIRGEPLLRTSKLKAKSGRESSDVFVWEFIRLAKVIAVHIAVYIERTLKCNTL